MIKLQALASKFIGLMARFLMRTASLLLTRNAKLEFISSCLAWVFKKLNRHSLEVNHESGHGNLRFAINSQGVNLNLSFMETTRPRYQQSSRNHKSFRSGMRPRRKSNGVVTSGNASDTASDNASDRANDKSHDVFDHIVGDILDAVIGEASEQGFDASDNQSSVTRNRDSVSSPHRDRPALLACNCGRFS